MHYLCILTLSISFSRALADSKVIRIQAPQDKNDSRPPYFWDILTLVIKNTEQEFGKAKWIFAKKPISQGQLVNILSKGRILDLLWTMTSIEREKKLLPIRIPLYKGLLGHRVCLLNKGEHNKFKGIKSAQDFIKKGYQIGQGFDWPDATILKSNGFSVYDAKKYKNIFKMLHKKRIDCFARGLPEPWREIKNFSQYDMIVDKHILFVYRAPIYFFVNKKNSTLALRIEKGLRTAIKDGSFDKLFYKYNGELLNKSQLNDRTIFTLNNPLLPPKTPINERELWLKTVQ